MGPARSTVLGDVLVPDWAGVALSLDVPPVPNGGKVSEQALHQLGVFPHPLVGLHFPHQVGVAAGNVPPVQVRQAGTHGQHQDRKSHAESCHSCYSIFLNFYELLLLLLLLILIQFL